MTDDTSAVPESAPATAQPAATKPIKAAKKPKAAKPDKNSEKGPRKPLTRLALVTLILAGLLVAVLGVGGYFVGTSWSQVSEAQTEVDHNQAKVSLAQSNVNQAQSALDSANSDYSNYLSCWLSMSWFWDFLCGDGSSYSLAVTLAELDLATAQDGLSSAQSKLRQAKSTLSDARDSLNLNLIAWGVSGGVLLLGAGAGGYLILRNKRRATQKTEATSTGWTCSACKTHNAGGLFCVECGSTKSASESAPAPTASATSTTAPSAGAAAGAEPAKPARARAATKKSAGAKESDATPQG